MFFNAKVCLIMLSFTFIALLLSVFYYDFYNRHMNAMSGNFVRCGEKIVSPSGQRTYSFLNVKTKRTVKLAN